MNNCPEQSNLGNLICGCGAGKCTHLTTTTTTHTTTTTTTTTAAPTTTTTTTNPSNTVTVTFINHSGYDDLRCSLLENGVEKFFTLVDDNVTQTQQVVVLKSATLSTVVVPTVATGTSTINATGTLETDVFGPASTNYTAVTNITYTGINGTVIFITVTLEEFIPPTTTTTTSTSTSTTTTTSTSTTSTTTTTTTIAPTTTTTTTATPPELAFQVISYIPYNIQTPNFDAGMTNGTTFQSVYNNAAATWFSFTTHGITPAPLPVQVYNQCYYLFDYFLNSPSSANSLKIDTYYTPAGGTRTLVDSRTLTPGTGPQIVLFPTPPGVTGIGLVQIELDEILATTTTTTSTSTTTTTTTYAPNTFKVGSEKIEGINNRSITIQAWDFPNNTQYFAQATTHLAGWTILYYTGVVTLRSAQTRLRLVNNFLNTNFRIYYSQDNGTTYTLLTSFNLGPGGINDNVYNTPKPVSPTGVCILKVTVTEI